MERKLPDKWKWIALKDLSDEFINGGTPSTKVDSYWNGTIPWITSASINSITVKDSTEYISEAAINETSANVIPRGNLLFVTRVGIGKAAVNAIDCSFSQDITGVVLKKNMVLPEYVARFIQSPGIGMLLKSWARGATIKGLQRDQLEDLLVPVPPLGIQRNIVSILDKAEKIKQQRIHANELTQNLLQSVFLEMFGDPFNNSKGWPIVKIKDVIMGTQYGTSERSSGNRHGYPILGMNNIQNNGDLDLSHTNFIEMSDEDFNKYRLEPGDLLFNRTNAVIHVGKTGLFSEGSNYVFASYLVRITVNREKIVPAFLWAYLNSPFIRKKFTGMCKKAVNQANINPTELGNLPIYLPPIHVQERFSQSVHELTVLKELGTKSMKTEETLCNALIAKAFTGELVA